MSGVGNCHNLHSRDARSASADAIVYGELKICKTARNPIYRSSRMEKLFMLFMFMLLLLLDRTSIDLFSISLCSFEPSRRAEYDVL